MIRIDRVSKFYNPDIVALKDVTFHVDKGDFVFLVGSSGAGKSTLIRLLIRQELPSEGSIMFDDTDVIRLKRALLPFYRQQIGVVFQDYKLIERKTIRENIDFALEITGKNTSDIEETTSSLLDVVNLSNREHLFPNQLSGGEKQRAGIARALANDPKLLIADEPTGNLDPETALEILSILKTINSWGTTVLVATHDRDIVNEMNRRVVRLEGGSICSDHIGGYDKGKTKTKTEKCPPSTKSVEKLKPKESPAESTEVSDISKLSLPKGIVKTLQKNNIHTIDSLLDISETELEKIDGIGAKKAQKIVKSLENYISEG